MMENLNVYLNDILIETLTYNKGKLSFVYDAQSRRQ